VSGARRRSSRPAPPGVRPGDPHARIHIAPVGFEVERVVEPVVTDRADRVYLVTRDGDDAARPFLEEVERRLAKARWPVEVALVPTPIWDVFGTLGVYRRIFESERRADRNASDVVPIRVNVSTGTKITAIAGTLACMLWRGEPYYVQVSRAWYSSLTPRVRAVNDIVRSIDPVSVYELRAPNRELVEVIEALEAAGGSLRKRELIRALGLERPIDGGTPPSAQAQHSRLRLRLGPLESKWGFVEADRSGGRGRVRLTPQGHLALTLFGRTGTAAPFRELTTLTRK
jgi:uncharacterized protein DUF6293